MSQNTHLKNNNQQQMMSEPEITWEILLSAYTRGYFPMAESQHDDTLHWFYPKKRGVLPLDGFHIPASLAKLYRKHPFDVRVDTAFAEVMHACAQIRTETRRDSWINRRIIDLYCELYRRGFAHSVECWKDDVLVGGLYGVSIGGAFFGESMFSKVSGASKIALIHLVERLNTAGYTLLDTQYVNDHLKQFGVKEITRASYLRKLESALNASPNPSMRFLMVSDIRSSTSGAR